MISNHVPQWADAAQQAFSSDTVPTLHNALPALEALHQAWSSCIGHDKYSDFTDALHTGTEKIGQYYELTANSHAYTMAMCNI